VFGRALKWKVLLYFGAFWTIIFYLVYFRAIWHILWSFGILSIAILGPFGEFCGHLVYFFPFRYLASVLVTDSVAVDSSRQQRFQGSTLSGSKERVSGHSSQGDRTSWRKKSPKNRPKIAQKSPKV
jgi:hypothetical protein